MNARGPETSRRGGYTLVEVTIAAVLLMTAMTVTVKCLGWVGRERRAADRRQWAVQEAANLMERLATEPFGRLSTARAREIVARSAAPQALPGASWSVAVGEERASPVPAKRVSVELRWKDRGEWNAPVRLTCWVFGRKGAS